MSKVRVYEVAKALNMDQKTLVALFQPHLYSRTRDFAAEFGRALLGADVAVVTDVYPSREKPLPGVTGQLIVRAAQEAGHRALVYLSDKKKVTDRLERLLKPGDLLVTMGAGDVVRFGEAYLAGEGARKAVDAGK